jgi:hypothetical protein
MTTIRQINFDSAKQLANATPRFQPAQALADILSDILSQLDEAK